MQIRVLENRYEKTIHDYDNYGEEQRYEVYSPSMLLIEEPETNLHPKWQSLLAEMFVEANKKFNIQFMIETHSEYLIRKFQTLVADNKINGEHIKIFYLRNPKNTSNLINLINVLLIQNNLSRANRLLERLDKLEHDREKSNKLKTIYINKTEKNKLNKILNK